MRSAQGVELLIVELTGYDIHIDVSFFMIDKDLALVNPMGLPYSFLEELKGRGVHLIEITPADDPWIVNSLAIAPGKLLDLAPLGDAPTCRPTLSGDRLHNGDSF